MAEALTDFFEAGYRDGAAASDLEVPVSPGPRIPWIVWEGSR